ncbi:hypothetical protein [Pleomorphomonas sp. JP5]|uniref:hypothetical protein n=1 Tax=Pleomorphomonas sp. JP5 TaxID=2942998 RepID=UPI002043A356|nr:hypothetical protein [Pleomorphomonas sp. JP5]MCM5558502.1 hypothetical protein [Pleomorphomonas sp. JP5]
MNDELKGIPERILGLATAALTQANMQAVFMDPGNEYWPTLSVLNAAHAGELFIKAVIAYEHPLLLFKDISGLDDNRTDEIDVDTLIRRGRTHDFERLPQILWASSGIRIANTNCFEQLRRARNAIQHFCPPDDSDLGGLSLEFIYTIIDPLIASQFGIFAIEYHGDPSVSYDYLVQTLLRSELRFSVPNDFDVTEISVPEALEAASPAYRSWFEGELKRVGRADLLVD